MPDAIVNLAISKIANATNPGIGGQTFEVESGHGSRFPTGFFDVTVHALGLPFPDPTNTEIARCTARSGDKLTVVRAQQGTTAQNVAKGWVIYSGFTAKTFTDLLVAGFAVDGGDGSLEPEDYGLTISFGDDTSYALFIPRGDTKAKALAMTRPLAAKEMFIETDTSKMKIGDGTSLYGALPYFGPIAYNAGEADNRYLKREIEGSFIIKGTPADKKILEAKSATTAEWVTNTGSSGLDEKALEKYAEEHFVRLEAPFFISGTNSATSSNPFLLVATQSNAGEWESASSFIGLYSQPRLHNTSFSTGGTKTLTNADTRYLFLSGSAGATIKLPTPIAQEGAIIVILNQSGGIINLKGVFSAGAAETTLKMEHEEAILFVGELTTNAWYPLAGYRSQPVMEEIVKQLLTAPLIPTATTSAALAIKGINAGTVPPVTYTTSAGKLTWQIEPDGSHLWTKETTGGVLKIKQKPGDPFPRFQIEKDGSILVGPGVVGSLNTTLSASLTEGTATGTTLAVNALSKAVVKGELLWLDDGAGHTQEFEATAAAAATATSITIKSFTPTFSFPLTTTKLYRSPNLDGKLERGTTRGAIAAIASAALESTGGLSGNLTKGAFVGVLGTGKPPTGGTFNTGDFAEDGVHGGIWVVLEGGTPGVWVYLGSKDLGAQLGECLGQSFDLPDGSAVMVPGTIYLAKIMVRGKMEIEEILTTIVKKGSGLTSGQLAIIAGENITVPGGQTPTPGAVLGKTSPTATKEKFERSTTTTGEVKLNLRNEADTANEILTLYGGKDGFFHVAMLCVGTEGPELPCSAYKGKLRDINLGTTAAGTRAGKVEGLGATSIKKIWKPGEALPAPEPYTPSSYKNNENDPLFWVAVKGK